MRKIYRNGDYNFLTTTREMEGEKVKHDGSLVFAVGEATGHTHTITVPNLEDMDIRKLPDGSYLVELKNEATVTHQEHSLKRDLKVAPQRYHLYRRREKDWFSGVTRKVVD